MKKSLFRSASFPYELNTLQELPVLAAEHFPDSVIQTFENGEQREYSYVQLRDTVFALSAVLCRMVFKGDQVALIGRNSYLWIASFLAITGAGATAVLIDREQPKEAMEKNLCGTDVKCVICDEDIFLAVSELCPNIPVLPLSWQIGIWGSYPVENSNGFSREVSEDDIAAIIFTSGSTGVNKGVLLSHKNLTSDIKASRLLTGVTAKDAIFSVLPPQHAFQLVTGILTPLYCGMRVGIGRGLKSVQKDFQLYQPTVMVLVPAIVRALYRQVQRTVERKNLTQKLHRAAKLSDALLLLGIDARRKLFAEIRAGFGGRLRAVICGGAHLEDAVVSGLNELGIPVLVGYGITECSPVVCCNMPRHQRIGSVGRPTPYGEVQIVDGEILVRGDIVSQGYYRLPELTEEAFSDGWFHTGDLGYLDKNGFLFISGRKKNIIVLSNGKNVSPEELETALQGIAGIKEAFITTEEGRSQEYLSALIVPEEDSLKKLGAEAFGETLAESVRALNQTLPSYKRVKSLQLLSGEMNHTASGKIVRTQPLTEENTITATIRI